MSEFININGKKMAVKFGFNALRHFSKMTGTSITELEKIGNNMTFDTALTLIYCGLMDGARVAKLDFKYTIDNLADDIDEDMSIIEKCMLLFAEQMSKATKPQKKSQRKGKK
jgi:hypothetical protein